MSRGPATSRPSVPEKRIPVVAQETARKNPIVAETNSKWRTKTSQLRTVMWSNLFFSALTEIRFKSWICWLMSRDELSGVYQWRTCVCRLLLSSWRPGEVLRSQGRFRYTIDVRRRPFTYWLCDNIFTFLVSSSFTSPTTFLFITILHTLRTLEVVVKQTSGENKPIHNSVT